MTDQEFDHDAEVKDLQDGLALLSAMSLDTSSQDGNTAVEMPPQPERFFPVNRKARRSAEKRNRALVKRKKSG